MDDLCLRMELGLEMVETWDKQGRALFSNYCVQSVSLITVSYKGNHL
jgi:hypothetical protein